MPLLLKQLSNKAAAKTTDIGLLCLAELPPASKRIAIILKRYKKYCIKIHLFKSTELNFQLPKAVKQKKYLCLFVIMDAEVSAKAIGELKRHSLYFILDYNPKESQWLKLACFLKIS